MIRSLNPSNHFYLSMMSKRSEHYHELEKPFRKIRISIEGQVISDTYEAIILKEVGRKIYDPTFYIPKKELDMSRFKQNNHQYECPIKGLASYWNFDAGSDIILENIAWSYENPIEYSRPIEGCLAFDTKQVTIELFPYE